MRIRKLPITLKLLTVLGAVPLVGCQFFGPQAIERGRPDYNSAIQKTSADMVLANIVRVHDGKMPLVMDVTQVNAALLFQGTLSSAIAGIGSYNALMGAGPPVATSSTGGALASKVVKNPTEAFGGTLEYQESPTVTYTPLSGLPLIAQLATPVSVDTLAALPTSNWPLSSVMKLSVSYVTPKFMDREAALNALLALDAYGVLSEDSSAPAPPEPPKPPPAPAAAGPAGSAPPPARVGSATSPETPAAGSAKEKDSTTTAAQNAAAADLERAERERYQQYYRQYYEDLYTRSKPVATAQTPVRSALEKNPGKNSILTFFLEPKDPNLWEKHKASASPQVPAEPEAAARRRILTLWVRLLRIYDEVRATMPSEKTLALSAPCTQALSMKSGAPVDTFALDNIASKLHGDPGPISDTCINELLSRIAPKQIDLRTDATRKTCEQDDCNKSPLMRTRSALGVLKAATELPRPLIEFVTPAAYKDIYKESWNQPEFWHKLPPFYTILPNDEDSTNACGAKRQKVAQKEPGEATINAPYQGPYCGNPDSTPELLAFITCYIKHSVDLFTVFKEDVEESFEPGDDRVCGRDLSPVSDFYKPEQLNITERRLANSRRFILIMVSEKSPDETFPEEAAYVKFFSDGKWYFISNEDLISKRNFALVSELMSIMAAPAQTTQPQPTFSVGSH